MLESVKNIIRKKPLIPASPLAKPGQSNNVGAMFRIGVPKEPISKNYLEELKRVFHEVQIVKQAAYVLFEESKKLSYLILLDLDVKPGQEDQALALIASSIHPYQETPFKGRVPVNFALWDSTMVSTVSSQDPTLFFFKRP